METMHGVSGGIRVLLAGGEGGLRETLGRLLGLAGDLRVVAEAAAGPQARAAAAEVRPDVAVLVVGPGLPGSDAVTLARELRAGPAGCRAVLLVADGDPAVVRAALEAGVRGLVPDTTSADDLAHVVRTVHAGRRYVAPDCVNPTGRP